MKKIIVSFIAILSFAVCVSAQVEGRVTDTKRNGIPNVYVTAIGVTGNTASAAQTDADGHYHMKNLAPGKYMISTDATAGFRAGIGGNVNVTADATIKLDIALKAAAPPPPPEPQPKDYAGRMTQGIARLDSPDWSTAEKINDLATQFEKIGDTQKTEWLPYYYAAMAVLRIGSIPSTDKDSNADRGNALLNKAEELSGENAEIYILRSLFATQQLMVDSASRYPKFVPEANQALESASMASPSRNDPLYPRAVRRRQRKGKTYSRGSAEKIQRLQAGKFHKSQLGKERGRVYA